MTKIEAPKRIWIQSDHIPDEVALNKWTTKPSASEAQLFTGYVRDDYVAKLIEASKPFAAIKIKEGRSQPGEIGRTDVTNIRAALAELTGGEDD